MFINVKVGYFVYRDINIIFIFVENWCVWSYLVDEI